MRRLALALCVLLRACVVHAQTATPTFAPCTPHTTATPLVVTRTADDTNLGSLRHEIFCCNTLQVQIPTPGTYHVGQSGLGQLEVTQSCAVVGGEATNTIITGDDANRVFHVTGATTDFTATDLTMMHGKAADADAPCADTGSGSCGGNLESSGRDTTLTRVTLSNGATTTAPTIGGGAAILGSREATGANGRTVDIENCTFSSNSAGTASNTSGGGLLVWGITGALTVNNTTFDANTSGFYGGAFLSNNNGGAIVENSTFNGNTAVSSPSANAGGLFFDAGGITNIFLKNSTFNGNTAIQHGSAAYLLGAIKVNNITVNGSDLSGGDVYVLTGTVHVSNSMIQGTCASLSAGLIATDDYNSNTGATCFPTPAAHDLNTTDCHPTPLANNGGSTQTMAIDAGSACYHAANPSASGTPPASQQTDQRGTSRAAHQSIGAFEPCAPITVTSAADSGAGTLRQAIIDANTNGPGCTITFSGSGCGTITLLSDLDPFTADNTILDGTSCGGTSCGDLRPFHHTTPTWAVKVIADNAANEIFRKLANNVVVKGIHTQGAVGAVKAGSGVLQVVGGSDTCNYFEAEPNSGIGIDLINTTGYVVGGPNAGDGNVLSGEGLDFNSSPGNGVAVQKQSTSWTVQGNLIGMKPDGATNQPNSNIGILVLGATNGTMDSNTIAANFAEGIGADQSLDNTPWATLLMTRNLIGTNYQGTVSHPNGTVSTGPGIQLSNGSGATIGDLSNAALGNIVSANTLHGIVNGSGTSSVVIAHNKVGVDANSAPLCNGGTQIFDTDSATIANNNTDACDPTPTPVPCVVVKYTPSSACDTNCIQTNPFVTPTPNWACLDNATSGDLAGSVNPCQTPTPGGPATPTPGCGAGCCIDYQGVTTCAAGCPMFIGPTPTNTPTSTHTRIPTRTPNATNTPGLTPTKTPRLATTHVNALELTEMNGSFGPPTNSVSCGHLKAAGQFPPEPDDDACRCVVYIKNTGSDALCYMCSDRVEHCQ